MDQARLQKLLHELAQHRDNLDEVIREAKHDLEDKFEFEVYPTLDAVNKTLGEIQLLLNEQPEKETTDGTPQR